MNNLFIKIKLLLEPGENSHSESGENRQFWPDENHQFQQGRK